MRLTLPLVARKEKGLRNVMSLSPHSSAAYSPKGLEGQVRRLLLCIAVCLLRTLLLGSLAVRVEHTSTCFAILRHEHGHVDIAATTFFVTLGDVLVEHVFEFVVLQAEVPREELAIVIELGVIGPADEN